MIEGLRLLPWFQEAMRERPAAVATYNDCDRCKMSNDVETRSRMGCGYLPPNPRAQPWIPDGFDRGKPPGDDPFARRPRDPETCVGYLIQLREVIEVSRASLHWEKGTLREWCWGDDPTPPLMTGLEELEYERNAVQAHRMETAQARRDLAAQERGR